MLFCSDKRGRGPIAVDKNAKQPWPDQTGCCVSVCVCCAFFSPCCYLASATVLSSEEKGERSNHGDVSLAARWLVVKGLEGVERLLQTLLCKQNEPD